MVILTILSWIRSVRVPILSLRNCSSKRKAFVISVCVLLKWTASWVRFLVRDALRSSLSFFCVQKVMWSLGWFIPDSTGVGILSSTESEKLVCNLTSRFSVLLSVLYLSIFYK